MKTNPNDSAFACSEAGTETYSTWKGQTGLTKLEYFAAMAMQGLRASCLTDNFRVIWKSTEIAKQAVMDAKALITELNKQQNETT